MTKLAYLSSTALCALALVAGVSPAAADGPPGNWGNQLYGSANLGYDWTMYNPNLAPDFHTHTFIGQGAVGLPLGNGWSAQGNFSFESQQFNNLLGPINFSIDTWQIGGLVGYQFDGQGRIGFDLAYQTVDFGVSVDGYRAGARGELFWRPDVTFRAAAGYQDYDTNGIRADGFYGSGGGSYYFSRNIGLRGNVEYYDYNITGFGPSSDYNVWDFGGKLQYKCDTYPLIFGAHANYATIDAFGNHSNDWVLGLDLTALFGIGAQDSSIRDAEANAPFEPMRIGVKHFTF